MIIVDQNQDGRLDNLIERYKVDLGITQIKTPVKGASRARNLGLESARGEIITFPDDENEYDDFLLEEVSRIFDNNSDFCGITLNSKDRYNMGSITKLSDKKGFINKINVLSKMIEFTIFIRKDKLGGIRFDETIGPGAASNYWCDEGPDFVLKLIEKGCSFMYYPNLYVYHPNPVASINKRVIEKSYNYGRARGRFLWKHNFPIWYVIFVWMKYVAGIFISFFKFNFAKSRYYYSGLKGRINGYLKQ